VGDPDTALEISAAPEAATATAAPCEASHITIEGSLETAPLDYYIRKSTDPPNHRQPYEPIFRSSPDSLGPTLRDDRENRVLLYPGSFNQPHLGHAALLWHAYLCTDDKTIAAIVLPLDTESLSSKAVTEVDDKKFILSKYKRAQLWKGTALRHFTWIYTAEHLDDYEDILLSLTNALQQDGFMITFATLYGGDHIRKLGSGWGGCAEIGSDVARPVKGVRGGYEEVKFTHCKKWRKVAMTQGQIHVGGPVPCRSCWPCRKLRGIYPRLDELTKVNSRIVSGDLLDILHRCHATGGLIWWAKQNRKSEGHKLFIPGGRRYANEATKTGKHADDDIDEAGYVFEELEESKGRGLKVNSTRIRELFFDSTISKDTFKAELATLAVNSELLAIYMGMDDRWMSLDVMTQRSTATQIKDDLTFVRRKDAASSVRRALY
jgi:nicotinic acid mononucleotide adenylyltransferase